MSDTKSKSLLQVTAMIRSSSNRWVTYDMVISPGPTSLGVMLLCIFYPILQSDNGGIHHYTINGGEGEDRHLSPMIDATRSVDQFNRHANRFAATEAQRRQPALQAA